MLLKHTIFNRNSINIFTDASLKNHNGIVSVCPGYCVYIGDVLVEQDFYIMHNATINQGELHAIMMGVMAAVKLRNLENIQNIRLFSDSQTSVFAIRDRIFKWINRCNDGLLCGVDGTPISNQDYIMNIIYYILQCNLSISFYHVKGHMKMHDYYDIQHAKSVFQKSNNINDRIDDELIRQICIGNNQVDRYTGAMLDLYLNDNRYQTSYTNVITIGYAPFDTKTYKTLITGGDKNERIRTTKL